MSIFEHNGHALHYLERGSGEPLLMVHGLGSSGADWAMQAPVLENRFRLIVPDLPGSGHSAPLRSDCSVEVLAQGMWALCDHLNAPRINVVGFSLGGAVGLEMALQRPHAVRRLALINSLATYRLDHWRKWLEVGLSLALIPALGMQRAARLAANRLFPMPWQAGLRERAAAAVSSVPPNNYLVTGRALLRWSAVNRLHRLKSKTLVLAAEHDFTPLKEKRGLATRLGADFIVVRGSRHGTPFDSVRATNDILWSLLTDQPMPPSERWVCDEAAHWESMRFAGSIAEEHAISLAKSPLYDPSAAFTS